MTQPAIDISVIVPTCNRSGSLRIALDSILAQQLDAGGFEVIVVDNGSTDDTRAVTERLQPVFPALRYLHEPEPGLHVGRHAGLRASRSELLVYVDDDIRALPGWLQAVKQVMADPEVAIAGGRVLPEWLTEPPAWVRRMWEEPRADGRMLEQLSIIDLGAAPREVPPAFIFGCNFAVRRSVLRAAGGFHPDGFPQQLIRFRGDGESWVSAYVAGQGLKAFYHPGASVYHRIPGSRLTEAYFRTRQYNQGVSDSYTRIREAGGISRDPRPFRTARRRLRRSLRRMLGRDQAPFADSSDEEIRRSLQESYRDGFAFHQQAVRQDPALLAWVLRESYLQDPGHE